MNAPSGYTELDLVGFTDKGAYNAGSTYVKNDLVHYQDAIYKCLKDDVTNVTPAEGDTWTVWIAPASGVASFNSRTGSVLPTSGDYSDNQINLSVTRHIGGGDQTTSSQALDALLVQLTPVGVVESFAAAKTGDVTGITTPTGVFPPSSAYLVCDGSEVNLTDYPLLANYFNTYYGNTYYFNVNGLNPNNGKFKLPNWSNDFPKNGVLCIKAK